MTKPAITTITMPFIFGVSVNCYLLKVADGFILIDTGLATQRRLIEQELTMAGVERGNLKLIVLTHGDPDHVGNASYLRHKFDSKIAMHAADEGMVERGDMSWNRRVSGFSRFALWVISWYFNFELFVPNFYLQEGDSLRGYHLDADIIELPGHSKGNIGILTRDGNLFCGDLLANTDKPALWTIIDDRDAAFASVEKLRDVIIRMVYPGHGDPFPMYEFFNAIDDRHYTPHQEKFLEV